MAKLNNRVAATLRLLACLFAVSLLANCQRFDEIDEARDFAAVIVDANRVRVRVLGDPLLGSEALAGTVYEAIPSSGSATFTGAAIVAAIDADDVDGGFALVGRSEVTVDFGAGTDSISGTMDDFQSSREGDGILDVSGQLQLQNGVVAAVSPNQFTVDYSGRVSVEGVRYDLSGDMSGRFLGTRSEPEEGQSAIRALAAFDIDGTVTGNDQNLTGRLTLIGEN